MPRPFNAHARRTLDRKLGALRPATDYTAPPGGWIRAVRDALGMSQAVLARRMGVAQPTLAGIERAESHGTVRLATLRRAAEALDCDLVCALVPRRPLNDLLRERAITLLAPHLAAIAHTMSLEAQDSSPDAEFVNEEIQRLIDTGALWK